MTSAENRPEAEFRIRVPGFVRVSQNNYRFAKMGEPVELRQDQMLAVPGNYPRFCYFVTEGQVVAGTSDGADHKRILLSFEENTLLLEQYLLTGKPSNLYYKAVRPTKARMISYHDLTQAMKLDFALTLDVINAISELGALAHQRQRSESGTTACQKVCDQLMDLALMYGTEQEGRIHIEEKITQEKIGALTGLHRITVTREIKKLKEAGILAQEEGAYSISSLREQYRMPEQVEYAGNVVDRQTGAWLSIGVLIRRDTYHQTGYLCREDASEAFHACVCALLQQIQDMPLIKTVLLTPDVIYTAVCGQEEPTEEIRYASAMALSALRQTLQGVLADRTAAGKERG